jgi:hypothetical protein
MASRGTVVEAAIWLLLWQALADKSRTLNPQKMISMHGGIATKLLHQMGESCRKEVMKIAKIMQMLIQGNFKERPIYFSNFINRSS